MTTPSREDNPAVLRQELVQIDREIRAAQIMGVSAYMPSRDNPEAYYQLQALCERKRAILGRLALLPPADPPALQLSSKSTAGSSNEAKWPPETETLLVLPPETPAASPGTNEFKVVQQIKELRNTRDWGKSKADLVRILEPSMHRNTVYRILKGGEALLQWGAYKRCR